MTKRYAILFLIILAAAATVAWATSDQVKDEAQLKQLVQTWDAAFVKGDAATLDRLLAAEFAFVGGPKKAEYLASFKTRPADAVQSAVSTDIQVQVYGDTAVLVGLDTISGQNKGQPQVTKWLYMDVWVKRDGRWQCVKTYSSAAR
jgi:ketosteroid isomerase-like protein